MGKQAVRIVLACLAMLTVYGMDIASVAAGKPIPPSPPPGPATPMQIFGAWHCGNHYCDWSVVRRMDEFDAANHWLIDRGDSRPSVNLVVLSFVNPLKLLNQSDTGVYNMIPLGMDQNVVNYFKSHDVRVMLAIGGITYTDDWDAALATNPTQLGLNAAQVALALGVGIEIDYENSSSPNLAGLQAFIAAYRSQLPYDASGSNPAARLTIDVGAGDRWLIALNRYATANWLHPDKPVLDYANAMVSGTASGTPTHWRAISQRQSGELQGLRVVRAEEERNLRADSGPQGDAPRLAGDAGHAGLHVLGGRIPVGAQGLRRHGATELLRGWHGCCGDVLQYSHSDDRIASTLRRPKGPGTRVTWTELCLGLRP
jgi:hypothetical protein